MKRKTRWTLLAAGLACCAAAAGGAYATLSQVPASDNSLEVNLGNVKVSLLETVPSFGSHGADTDQNWKNFWVLARGTKETIVRARITCGAEYLGTDGSTYTEITELTGAQMYYDASGTPVKYAESGTYYTADGEAVKATAANPVSSPFTYEIASADNWVYNPQDGYWYYTRVLNEGNAVLDTIAPDAARPEDWPAGEESTTDQIGLEDLRIAGHRQKEHPGDECNDYSRYIRQNTRMTVNIEVEGVQATNGAYLLMWGNVDEAIINQIGREDSAEIGKVAADRNTAIENEARLADEADRVLTNIYRQR